MQITHNKRVYQLVQADVLPMRELQLIRSGFDGTQWYGTPVDGSKFFAKVTMFCRTKAGKFVPTHPYRDGDMNEIEKQMQKAFATRNPQLAADIIAAAVSSTDQQARMDAAARAGFSPEYYASSIRVHLP